MLGLPAITAAVHEAETVFKDPPGGWERGTLDALFEISAALRRAVDQLGTAEEESALERVERLGAALGARSGDAREATTAAGQPEPEPEHEPAPPAQGPGAPPNGELVTVTAGSSAAGEVVRVPFAGLDALLTRVGELVTLETRVEALLTETRGPLEAAGVRQPLEEAAEGLARITGFLHETTIELRLVPVRRVFERFPSVVRDLARRGGKRVRLETHGDEVRIDKALADEIAEPLLHLVRNAVDHGFDADAESVGTISLSATRAGDRLRLAVEDDGKGLDRAGIIAQARETGVIAPNQPFDESEAGELIFMPGFSTRGEATTVSGRGVGLDVVRRKAIALRGSLAVEASASGGTRFVLDLPVTLAIVPAVLFESGGEIFAVPAADVDETIRGVTVTRAGGAEVVVHREEPVPVARPGDLFGWSGAARVDEAGARGASEPGAQGLPPAPAARAERFAIVARHGSRRLAILSHRLLDQRDIVVKALPGYLGALPAVSGATVTHEARVVLVLDVAGLIDLNLTRYRRENRGR